MHFRCRFSWQSLLDDLPADTLAHRFLRERLDDAILSWSCNVYGLFGHLPYVLLLFRVSARLLGQVRTVRTFMPLATVAASESSMWDSGRHAWVSFRIISHGRYWKRHMFLPKRARKT